MDANEFWCRAFLAMWNGEASRQRWKHDGLAEHCERAADAALAVAQRRGMVTGERTASAPAEEPELERVEFTADRDGDIWTIHASGLIHGVQVRTGGERYPIGPIDVLCVKWGETMPPKPIEVWLERPAISSRSA